MTVIELGGGRARVEDGIDHSVGFDRLLGLGAQVNPGDPIGRIHARGETEAAMGAARLVAAYGLAAGAPAHPLILDRILPESS